MKTRASEIADFFQQLALLVRSGLPLPSSLRQLGRYVPRADFRRAILEIGARTERGEKFSDVLRQYPRFFDAFHAQLLAAGDSSGALPEMLLAVARSARFGETLTTRARDTLGYPLITIHLCAIVGLVLSHWVIPPFGQFYVDLLGGCPLPAMTGFVMNIGHFVNAYFFWFAAAYVVLAVFSVWMFTPGIAAHRTMLAVLNRLPGSWHIADALDGARLCGFWSAFVRQRVPFPDALWTSAQLVERSGLRLALARAAQKAEAGQSPADVLAAEPILDPLIALTFRHTPENELADELAGLAELYDHRVGMAARSATMTWSALGIIFMAVCVGMIVMSLFVPLITVITMLGR